MDGFGDHRQAAKRGIHSAGGEPVLVEELPSLSVSSRNACLDGVASCDIYIAILGDRGGWTAPSGKLVVEEEYEEAIRHRICILAFIQRCDRDADGERLVSRVSDYIDGLFRHTYTNPSELESAVELSLTPLIRQLQKPEVIPAVITERLNNPHRFSNETGLRFVLAPERVDEMVDPVALGTKEFGHRLLEIGHTLGVDLFSYDYPKTTEIGVNEIVLIQSGEKYRRQGSDEVRLELTTRGMLVVDLNVTGRPSVEGHENYLGSLVLIEEDIIIGLKRSFAFACAYYRERDPFKRYDRMVYNVALSGIGMRTLMARPPQGSNYPMGSHGETIVTAFDDPRLITRADLENPRREIEAALTLFRRRLR
ncbi:MAG: DUF4062 domain-containing protein [Deltaproteobacteria bacterium]|nr:DUF4062 domain-containing protein [Deltaproteobacteria bacterium]